MMFLSVLQVFHDVLLVVHDVLCNIYFNEIIEYDIANEEPAQFKKKIF